MPFEFGIKDIIDIVSVAILLYYIYRLMKNNRSSLNVFIGIIVFVIFWLFVSQILEMRLLGAIMDKVVSVGVIGFIVLFQPEIRKFLYSLGAHQQFKRFFRFFQASKKGEKKADQDTVLPIVNACMHMSRGKVGSLIVIERGVSLEEEIDAGNAGEVIDARISSRLIENIFFKNSPLHDGAMIISQGRIKAAGCLLPVSHDEGIPHELGLRHRAAFGITQQTDALAIVTSEETGRISVAYGGNFKLRLSGEELESILNRLLYTVR